MKTYAGDRISKFNFYYYVTLETLNLRGFSCGISIMTNSLILVADTNLFLECKKLEELPWQELGADEVIIQLTAPVLSEIDKHKKSTGRTRERAIEINSKIGNLLNSYSDELTVRDNNPKVTLRIDSVLTPDAKLASTLDYSSNDDRLVGITSQLAENLSDAGASVKFSRTIKRQLSKRSNWAFHG